MHAGFDDDDRNDNDDEEDDHDDHLLLGQIGVIRVPDVEQHPKKHMCPMKPQNPS